MQTRNSVNHLGSQSHPANSRSPNHAPHFCSLSLLTPAQHQVPSISFCMAQSVPASCILACPQDPGQSLSVAYSFIHALSVLPQTFTLTHTQIHVCAHIHTCPHTYFHIHTHPVSHMHLRVKMKGLPHKVENRYDICLQQDSK